ncbi:MAG: CBS domain-containing protein [Firmicutes bacterium]|nr:CBS domain-containing protein [Bacillota bacterium]
MKVVDDASEAIMSRDVITVNPDSTVREAVELMLKHRISGLPVVDGEGKLVGLLTENDLVLGGKPSLPVHLQVLENLLGSQDPELRTVQLRQLAGQSVSKLMTREVTTARPQTPVGELVNLLVANDFKRISIIENGQLVGIVTQADIVRVMAEKD